MAIFGSKKAEKKVKAKNPDARVRSTRAAKLPKGRGHEIILAPWFSEKALIATDKGVYTFAVPASANKSHIAAAIKELYNVAPRKVRVVNLPGRRVSKRSRGGHAVSARRRKAYVYLKQGDTIQFA